MIKIFFNYLREQRKNIIQILGLGFLVMIMIVTFLSIEFSNQYVKNQYVNDISHNTNFQELNERPIEENKFQQEYSYYKNNLGLWLENMSYYCEDDSIDTLKLQHATFQITLVNKATDTYRFSFNGSSNISNPHANNFLQVGKNLAIKFNHNYVDFKLLVPNGYQPANNCGQEYKSTMRNLINKYVYDGSSVINEVNYFILNDKALKIYQNEIYQQLPYANHQYSIADIDCQAQLYYLIINGMLFQSIEWNQYSLVNDLLMTGKSFLFTQTVATNVIDPPILVGNYQQSLEKLPLQDNEILIYQQFAAANNLKIGDKYNIVNRTFIIRGFATSRNSAFIGNNIGGIIDPKNKTVAFVNSNTMININREFKNFIDKDKQKNSFNPVYPQHGLNPWLYKHLHQQLAYGHHYQNLNNGINFANVASILRNDDYFWIPYNQSTIFYLQQRIVLTQNIGVIFLGLIFIVTSVIILMVVWKMIHHNHKLIGILKALGYKNWQLTSALILSLIWPLLIFAVFGVLISLFVSHMLINSYDLIFALINYGWYINFQITIIVLIMPLVLLTIISFLLVYLFLQKSPLDLITSKHFKKYHHLNISKIIAFISTKVISNVSYRNKLVTTTSIRSFGKLVIISTVSGFAATLMLFSVAASGLVNDMLSSQYQGINFNYLNIYHYQELKKNFINTNNQLIYSMAPVSQIKTGKTLQADLTAAIDAYLKNPNNPPPVNRDLRDKYILGSQLLLMRKNIENPLIWKLLPTKLKKQWKQQINIINYLTNDNGNDNNDLLISFGIIPYQPQRELPFIKINIENSYDLDFSNNNIIGNNYDSNTETFNKQCFTDEVAIKQTMYGVTTNSSNFIKANLTSSKFSKFPNLNINSMSLSDFWLDKEFTSNIKKVKSELHITNTNAPNVTFLPIVASTAPKSNCSTGNGNDIGKAILYPYSDFNGQQKYLIGIVYDSFSNLGADAILVSYSLLNNAINENTGLLINNAKMSKFNENELRHYLTFINTKNNYYFDLTKILNPEYLATSNFTSSLSGIVAIGNEKLALESNVINMQLVIVFFAICSIILSFTIMTLIANILVRDNWILINTLKVLGYTNMEVSYNFIIIIVPLILIFSIFSVLITPILINMLTAELISFSNIIYPLIFRWWYFLLAFGINIVVYLTAYIITWYLNFRKYNLWSFIE